MAEILKPRWQALADFAEDRQAQDRFWESAERAGADECWHWTGKLNPNGYGSMTYAGFTHIASRLSWALANGRSPANLLVCHTCDNPPCVNPAHLFLGSHGDNVRDMVAKGRHVRPDRDEANIGRMRGAKSNFAILTEADVPIIRARRAKGERFKDIAADFGIHRTTVAHIIRGRSWKHV